MNRTLETMKLVTLVGLTLLVIPARAASTVPFHTARCALGVKQGGVEIRTEPGGKWRMHFHRGFIDESFPSEFTRLLAALMPGIEMEGAVDDVEINFFNGGCVGSEGEDLSTVQCQTPRGFIFEQYPDREVHHPAGAELFPAIRLLSAGLSAGEYLWRFQVKGGKATSDFSLKLSDCSFSKGKKAL